MPAHKLPYLGVLKLRDLPFALYNCDTQPFLVSITDHPYYRSLEENDPSIFLSHYKGREHLPDFVKNEYSWEGFLALKEKIRLDGWHPDLGPPITVRDGGQLDGTHRLSILCHLHSPDTLVMIIDGNITYPVPQQPDLIERFSNAASQLALDKATQISTLENALAHCKNERDYAISQLQAAKDQLEVILSEKRALLSSNSWQLTKPLRLIKDWFFTNS
jgi:hypothetical protein